jgi:hypothetical protein
MYQRNFLFLHSSDFHSLHIPMLYLFTDPADPHDSRAFLYHFSTHTLAEHFITATGNHHLRVHQNGPIDNVAMLEIAAWLKTNTGTGDLQLNTMSGKVDYSTLPEHLIIASTHGEKSIIIHYPAFGLTAGLCEDGTKIPPYWRDPAAFTSEQRSQLIQQAAEILMRTIANYL